MKKKKESKREREKGNDFCVIFIQKFLRIPNPIIIVNSSNLRINGEEVKLK